MADIRKQVRDRIWLYLSDEVAGCANLTLADLKQAAIGSRFLKDRQIEALTGRRGLA
jgi:hypothetical protein